MFRFVLPDAIVGAYLQTVRGRPVMGAFFCFVTVVILPLLLWSAGITGAFVDLTGGR